MTEKERRLLEDALASIEWYLRRRRGKLCKKTLRQKAAVIKDLLSRGSEVVA